MLPLLPGWGICRPDESLSHGSVGEAIVARVTIPGLMQVNG